MAIVETFSLFGRVPVYTHIVATNEKPRIISLGRYRTRGKRQLLIYNEDRVSIREVRKFRKTIFMYAIDEHQNVSLTRTRRDKKKVNKYIEHASLYQDAINAYGSITSQGKIIRRSYAWTSSPVP